MELYFNNKIIFKILNKWKFHLAIVAVVSIGLGAFVSSPVIIKPKFKSTTVLYPVNLPTVSDENPTEQMLQLLKSTDLREKVFRAFNLAAHYEIDTTGQYWKSDLVAEFESNVSFSKTEYESVEVEVLDITPKVASDIVDSIIIFYNQLVRELHREKSKEVVIIAKTELDKKKHEIDSLEFRLKTIRNDAGLFDYRSQAKEATTALLSGKKSDDLKQLIVSLKEKGGEYRITDSLLWASLNYYSQLKIYHENQIRDVKKILTYAHVVSKPYPADKKTYPVRWLIVLACLGASLGMMLIVIIFIESSKNASPETKPTETGKV